jgi:hypothetical protein
VAHRSDRHTLRHLVEFAQTIKRKKLEVLGQPQGQEFVEESLVVVHEGNIPVATLILEQILAFGTAIFATVDLLFTFLKLSREVVGRQRKKWALTNALEERGVDPVYQSSRFFVLGQRLHDRLVRN